MFNVESCTAQKLILAHIFQWKTLNFIKKWQNSAIAYKFSITKLRAITRFYCTTILQLTTYSKSLMLCNELCSDSFHAMLAWKCGRAKYQCCTATVTVVVYIPRDIKMPMWKYPIRVLYWKLGTVISITQPPPNRAVGALYFKHCLLEEFAWLRLPCPIEYW